MVAFTADHSVPSELVDTSRVCISAGYLEPGEIIAVAEEEQPDAVLFRSGRLRRILGFRAWVREHYQLVQVLGHDQELYVRRQGG